MNGDKPTLEKYSESFAILQTTIILRVPELDLFPIPRLKYNLIKEP